MPFVPLAVRHEIRRRGIGSSSVAPKEFSDVELLFVLAVVDAFPGRMLRDGRQHARGVWRSIRDLPGFLREDERFLPEHVGILYGAGAARVCAAETPRWYVYTGFADCRRTVLIIKVCRSLTVKS